MSNKFQISNSQRGVSLIITFFIMIIILAAVLSLSVILYSEIRVIKNIGNSVVAFYAADSGVEKLLFYDRQVLPIISEEETAARGLCSMCDFDQTSNPGACVEDPGQRGGDTSIYCNNCVVTELSEGGCQYDICNNCEVYFEANFDNKNYYVFSSVSPSIDGTSSELVIQSKGSFYDVERQIEISSKKRGVQDIIKIENACVEPRSAPYGDLIIISANVSSQISGGVISFVSAVIKNSSGDTVLEPDLSNPRGNYWEYSWLNGAVGLYHVDIIATDSFENTRTEPDIPSCD